MDNEITGSEMRELIFSLRALKNWPADKAYYAATVIVIEKSRNLRRTVQALAEGKTYREALRAGKHLKSYR